ncbi:MAG: efflux RND transporter permease subunit [Oscillospiraceae bacterium]|jgi:HAE1 family hydrophobic/amphiphilic exporter-1|nr:efflux RND transporter permease subunit [Oscillospiraceae bacterium]
MFAKVSVRKPFTVLVGIILIIILGVVSFMNTTTDLLPSMNLPYAVVLTTYIGATPEQVEVEITAPIESRMGIISGIKSISSVSSESFSMIILEFTDDTNMDSASLEIRESVDMLTFPDNVSKPTILRLNPDMMPIMVTSVYAEGMTMSELSEFAKNTVAPAFEGIPGVASVSPSGLIQNQLYIVINEEKIAQVNANMLAAVEKMRRQGEAAFHVAMEARITELMMEGVPLEEAQATAMAELLEQQEQQQNSDGETPSQGLPNLEEMLTIGRVRDILMAQNLSMPAGFLESGNESLIVRVGDRLRSTDDVSNLLIFDPSGLEGMAPVRLSDVADVIVTDNSDTQYTRVNGSPAVMLTMQKQAEFSTADLTREIRAKMDELSGRHSDFGLEFAVMMDQGHYIDVIVSSILNNLLIGGLLALIILVIFLRDLRPTLVVGISIPVSLMLAFTVMYFTGISLNIISMSGLALSVGMLIDNSIVVIDNIYRLRSQGMAARRAAVQGAVEVSGAIIACTLTTIAVFLPIVFTQGLTRQLFTDLGLTIAYALLASLLIALTVVPASSSAVFYRMKEKEHKLFNRFRDGYGKLLRGSLKVKWAVLLLPLAAVIATGIIVYSKGMEFFPAMDSEEIVVSVGLPEGSTFEEAVEIAEMLSAHIKQIEDIEHVGAIVSGGGGGMLAMMGQMFGMSGGGGGGSLGIDIYLLMSESRTMSNQEIADLIMEKDGIGGSEITVAYDSQSEMNFLTGDEISINITGRELDDLRDTALEVAEIVRGVEGAVNIMDGSQRAAPELRIIVDKDEAMSRGLTTFQVLTAAAGALSNPEAKISMSLSGLDYEVIIQDASWSEPDRDAIESIVLVGMTGEVVGITEVAEIREDTGFTSIRRQDNARYITVRGEIEEGYNVTLVNDEIARRLADYTPLDGCTVTIRGESEAINDAFLDLYLMLALALAFIYLIMVAQFQSLLSPFIVMFTIPLGFTGGFIGLLIADMRLSVVAMIGLVLLAGVIVSNGIVFVDCINRLRRQGLTKKDAVVEAGKIRLRPILMTALTTIAAMSTMTIGMGMGTEMVQPMAVTVVGGLAYATLMTLFVVPCMYDLLHRNRDMTKDEDLDYDKAAGEK